jgi:hypothetical protein
VLYLLLLSKKVAAALSWCSRMMLSSFSPVFERWGLPKGPRSSKAGSMSKRLSYLFGRDSDSGLEFLVPIDELASVPMMWVVFLWARMFDRKSEISELKS